MTATPVNDHEWLTHEMVMDAIRNGTASDLVKYAREARTVGANGLADQLDGFASDRAEVRAEPIATHRLTGVEVHSLIPATNPWHNDPAAWSEAIRVDNGERVTAPTTYFVEVETMPASQRATVDALRAMLAPMGSWKAAHCPDLPKGAVEVGCGLRSVVVRLDGTLAQPPRRGRS